MEILLLVIELVTRFKKLRVQLKFDFTTEGDAVLAVGEN